MAFIKDVLKALRKRKISKVKEGHWAIPSLRQIEALLTSRNGSDKRLGKQLAQERRARLAMSDAAFIRKYGRKIT